MRIRPLGEDELELFLDAGALGAMGAGNRWIAPLRAAVAHELSGSGFFRHGRARLFLAEDEGRAVGRIAALVNARLTDGTGAPLGQLGYFECVDDPAIARALVDAAASWLSSEGARQLLGPSNGGAHRLHRSMVRGFDRAPFLLEPRNPPYYPRLFQAAGLSPVHRWVSYEIARTEAERLHGRFARLCAARPSDRAIELIPTVDPARALGRLHPLLDRLWAGHVGYAPLDQDELAETFTGLLALMTERHLGVLVQEGRDVGCAFMYPDYADEVRALDGDARGWGRWLGGAWPRRLVLHTVAVLPEARDGLGTLALVERGLRHFLEDGYDELVIALVTEELRFFDRVAAPTREYALYGRSL